MKDYRVLATKWRPRFFQQVIGQEHVTRSLINIILKNKVGHAYLFTGTRGVGKTSVARIFAKAIRCQNIQDDGNYCGSCLACQEFGNSNSLNIHEIDGASNNSVDHIRELVSDVNFLPTNGKYRVYIIDEIHMLSPAAFNAMLKTLEEPPAHVVFIFATTEPAKLLETVLSRCQRFDFKTVPLVNLVAHIEQIAEQEEILFEDNSLIKQICREGNGSVRDTLTLLDQVLCFAGDEKITEDILGQSLGLARRSAIQEIKNALLKGELSLCSESYRKLLRENIPLKNIIRDLLDQLFDFIQRSEDSPYSAPELFWIYETLSRDAQWALTAPLPEKIIEIILQKITLRREFFSLPKEENSNFRARKTWEEFLALLRDKSLTMLSNLEHGALIKPIDLQQNEVEIHFGFPPSSQLFYEYFQDEEIKAKLVAYLGEFFEVDRIHLNINLESKPFKSQAETLLKKEEERKHKQREDVLNRPIIKEAQSLFNTKIDKVYIKQ
jgi:DNA polymerase-3 subunit gamma/tau